MYRTIRKYLSEKREQKEIIDGKVISKDIFGRATVQTATGTFKAVDLRGRGTASVMINNTAQNQNEFAILAGNQERNIIQPTYYDLPNNNFNFNLIVVDTCNYRIQLLNKNGTFISSFGSESIFGMIRGIAATDKDNIYISEQYPNYKVYQYDSSGNRKKELDANGGIYWPLGICFRNDYIFIANGEYIEKFDADGNYIKSYNFSCEYPSSYLYDVAIDSNSNYIVSYFQNNIVRKYDSQGNLIFTLGTQSQYDEGSNDDGKFWSPRGVAVDSQDNIYICDAFNCRIQKFDNSGNFVLKFGSYGNKSGQFNIPCYIRIDSGNNLYISDFLNNRIQVFSSSGSFIKSIGTQGNGTNQFNMPMGIAIL